MKFQWNIVWQMTPNGWKTPVINEIQCRCCLIEYYVMCYVWRIMYLLYDKCNILLWLLTTAPVVNEIQCRCCLIEYYLMCYVSRMMYLLYDKCNLFVWPLTTVRKKAIWLYRGSWHISRWVKCYNRLYILCNAVVRDKDV